MTNPNCNNNIVKIVRIIINGSILCVLLPVFYLGLPHYNNFFVKIYADAKGLHKLAAAITRRMHAGHCGASLHELFVNVLNLRRCMR